VTAKQFRSIRGIHDGLPADAASWRRIEQAARAIFERYGFSEVRLPVLEPAGLFVRSIGEETDIVAKEMYRFEDRGGDDICLRPEGTAGAVRAWLQAGLTRAGARRWYYMGPMFRRERPQKGRLRQFQQIGVEWFGVRGPEEDAETLAMAWELITALGIGDIQLEINSLGCDICRPDYRASLVAWLRERSAGLCKTCLTRMDVNPLRVLDCKVESCGQVLTDAPEMQHHLCAGCRSHFNALQGYLDHLRIPYVVNGRIVRGLDYYTRTAFEIVTKKLGAQGTVIAGGRYDGLVAELGGPATPAIGFALGLERLAMLLPDAASPAPDIALLVLSESAQAHGLDVARRLRQADLTVIHCGTGSARALFRRADRENARFVAIIGEDEINRDALSLKDMRTGEQSLMPLDEAIAACKRAATDE